MVKGLTEDTDEGTILDAFTPMAHVKEIRLARERGSKVTSRWGGSSGVVARWYWGGSRHATR